MKQLWIAFVLTIGTIQGIFAQQIEIRGAIKDATNKESVEFANVVLQTTDSVFIAGTAASANGRFALEKVMPGDYLLIVSGLGYRTQYLQLDNLKESTTLGDIMLEEELVALDNVIVSASNLSSQIDKKLIYPSEMQVKAATNGIDLLQQLMLPKLRVNPLFNEVSLPGGGELQYRINGVKVEIQDVIALQPADIIRIEFHDNPGLRYGNTEAVLDYIVRRPETGGNMGVNLSDALAVGWGNNNVNGRINHKKSEFSFNYGINHRNFHKMWRDNEEAFTFADGTTLHRREAGEPGHLRMLWQNLNTAYSYQNDKRMLNATIRYYKSNMPHFDYKGWLYNMENPAERVRMIDQSSEIFHRPALDLYYQENLKNDQTLVINLVGTYNYTNNARLYQESLEEALLTDVDNRVIGKKYSWIGEGIYEKKFGENRLGAGLKHTQAYTDNEYRNGHRYLTEMTQAETFLYSEFKGKAKKLDYTLGVGVTRSYFGQEGEDDSYNYYTFNPRLVFQYTLPGHSSIRLNANISNSSPSLSNLSAVEQMVDSFQIQRGNPNLKPFLRYRSELTYELQKGIFYGNLWGTYEYHPGAIMDEKYLEGSKIVQTWNNQKDWQRMASRLTLRVGPVKDILQLSATGGVNHYISNGNTYHHTYTNWFTETELSASWKKLTGSLGLETNWNRFYGETMEGGENIHYLMLGYKQKDMTFIVGMFNPFVDNYKQESENRSQYASYKKSNYINESSRMLLVRFAWNFSFGRTFKADQKRLNNSDDDSGVMSTGK